MYALAMDLPIDQPADVEEQTSIAVPSGGAKLLGMLIGNLPLPGT